ncbi:MAG: hypothetical protein V4722_15130 [Bacteroidota bacterium]
MRQFINKLTLSPKKLFLVDGVGAFLTAFFLFAILRTFHDYFGMPGQTLTLLSIIAMAFSVYSFCCFFMVHFNWYPFLRAISIANLLYCSVTLGLVIYNYPRLTILGVIYFLVEIVIVCALVFLENKCINHYQQKKKDQIE